MAKFTVQELSLHAPLKYNMPVEFNAQLKGWTATADEDINVVSLVVRAPMSHPGSYRIPFAGNVRFYRVTAAKPAPDDTDSE